MEYAVTCYLIFWNNGVSKSVVQSDYIVQGSVLHAQVATFFRAVELDQKSVSIALKSKVCLSVKALTFCHFVSQCQSSVT